MKRIYTLIALTLVAGISIEAGAATAADMAKCKTAAAAKFATYARLKAIEAAASIPLNQCGDCSIYSMNYYNFTVKPAPFSTELQIYNDCLAYPTLYVAPYVDPNQLPNCVRDSVCHISGMNLQAAVKAIAAESAVLNPKMGTGDMSKMPTKDEVTSFSTSTSAKLKVIETELKFINDPGNRCSQAYGYAMFSKTW